MDFIEKALGLSTSFLLVFDFLFSFLFMKCHLVWARVLLSFWLSSFTFLFLLQYIGWLRIPELCLLAFLVSAGGNWEMMCQLFLAKGS